MRTLRVLIVVLAAAGFCLPAAAQEFSEDFESYAAGTQLHGVAGWKGWGNAAGAGAPVSDKHAFSGKNSVEVTGGTDLVHEFTPNGGLWEFSAMQYIPEGATGETYFIMLNQYDDPGATNDWSVQLHYNAANKTITAEADGGNATATIIFGRWVQLKFILDLDNNTCAWYYDGVLVTTHPWDAGTNHTTFQAVDLYANNASPVYYDDIKLSVYVANRAYDPSPADGQADIAQDAQLSWRVGDRGAAHDVYFGTSYDDVDAASTANPLGVLVEEGSDETTFDPGLLEIGGTYYWRIDEVGGESGNPVIKGYVWQFTVEPFSYAIGSADITASASSSLTADMGPEKTIDGSGLVADQHSTEAEQMWLSVMGDTQPWIQYEFDRAYSLDKMLVWNANQAIEPMLGFGIKGVTIEVSVDGETWTSMGDFEFAQAGGLPGYMANTTVDFAGAAAKFVKLTIASNWGALPQYGLSEVRFFQIPTAARKPNPASGAADVSPAATLTWRPGRGAVSHEVFLGTDAASLASVGTVREAAYEADLALSQTYFWKVVEINEAATPSTWEGPVWSFTTGDSFVVDDFESYNDDMEAGEAIFQTWIDGYDVVANGSIVGHDQAPFAERTTVFGGVQSMPLAYDNSTGATYSEATRTFDVAQDWTKYGLKTLSLYFYGATENTGSGKIYIKINDTKVSYDGAADLNTAAWTQWTVDLASTGADLKKVTSVAVGVDGSGAWGSLFIDEIRLFP